VLAVTLFAMVVLNFASIVFRYWIHVSLPWVEEVEVGLFIWLVFLGAGVTVVRRMHIGFGAVTALLPARLRSTLAATGLLAFTGFFLVLGWYGGHMVADELGYDQRTPTLGWPEAVIGAAVPAGAGLALARIAAARVRRTGR